MVCVYYYLCSVTATFKFINPPGPLRLSNPAACHVYKRSCICLFSCLKVHSD